MRFLSVTSVLLALCSLPAFASDDPLELSAETHEISELERILDEEEPAAIVDTGNYRQPSNLARGTEKPLPAGKNTALYNEIDQRIITDELELQTSDVEYEDRAE